ncbi:hypothetical protein GCM10022398_30060 [Acetobacter lovaniensis]|uniref:Uncharacterized protein n=1 Tax=Acetobacter lovaniensis TaxID=104100 RepID=A0A841QER4_9PROT|nr:hypothetical protein [Acetobacter lovaniensis]
MLTTSDHQASASAKLKEIVADDKILWGVVANARPTRNKMRWEQVMRATGNGSTVCALLCVRFGFDPYEVKK